MRRWLLLLLLLTTAGVACLDHNKTNGTLSSGTYQLSGYVAGADGCGVDANPPSSANGTDLVVLVSTSGAGIRIQGASGVISGNNLSAVEVTNHSWAPIQCLQSDTLQYTGQITGNDAFDAAYTVSWTQVSGTGCALAMANWSAFVGQTVTLPCGSIASFHLTKIGPPPPTPRPITGTLTTAYGLGALAAFLATDSHGTGFFLSATLDSVAVSGTGGWACLAPDPSHGFPDYDLLDPLGHFTLQVTTASWTVGAHPIDGVTVVLTVTTGNRSASATGGTVILESAGTLAGPGRVCRFSTGGVPLSGSQTFLPAVRAATVSPR